MNRFFNKSAYGHKFKTFDEHIAYLESQIKQEENWIADSKETIEEYKKEIEEVKAAKVTAESDPLTHKPNVYLDGWADTEEKKQEVYEWCQAHELLQHPETVGNYWKEDRKVSEKIRPTYEFITASSDTSKVRFVRCLDCFKKFIKDGTPKDSETYERYLKG